MVLFDEGLYKMWYSASDGTNFRILYAESSDGRSWSNYQLAVNINQSGTGLDAGFVYSPFVVKDGSTYKMWYSAQTGVNVRTLYAESSDGINWSNFSLALELNSTSASVDDRMAFSTSVLGNYRIWYTAVNSALNYQIASCTSADGIARIWYYAASSETTTRIMYAESLF